MTLHDTQADPGGRAMPTSVVTQYDLRLAPGDAQCEARW